MPTEKAGGTELPTRVPEPAHNPRPWGRLQLQQQDAKAALSAQHLQQLPDSGQRPPPGSPPLQELSNNSSDRLAAERPRGFQGKLRLRKNRSGTGAVKRGHTAAAPGQQSLQAPSEAASASAHTARRQDSDHNTEQHGGTATAEMATAGADATIAASPEARPVERGHAAAEDTQDLVDITPERPQWRSKQSSRLQQLAESAPVLRHAGSGRLTLLQQPLMHVTGSSTLQQYQQFVGPALQQESPEEHAGSLGLSLEHPRIASCRLQGDSSSSRSLQRLRAAGFVPETCAQACDAVPDTPDCRTSKQGAILQSPKPEAPLAASQSQQESLAEQHRALHVNSSSCHMRRDQPCNGHGPIVPESVVSQAPDMKRSGRRMHADAASEGHHDSAAHGSRYYFGKPVVSASACSSGGYGLFLQQCIAPPIASQECRAGPSLRMCLISCSISTSGIALNVLMHVGA